VRILFVAAEAEPLVKVGGLADVIGALPVALAHRGHDVRIALPYYGLIQDRVSMSVRSVCPRLRHPLFERLGVSVSVSMVEPSGGVPAYLVGTDRWFHDASSGEEVYVGDPGAYVVFDRACAMLASGAVPEFAPEVVHCHDWHTGLTGVYLATERTTHSPARVFTIHNLAYAGVFGPATMKTAGLADELFTFDKLEYYGGFSFLKAGIVYSDMCNTVSVTYAREVESTEYGGGMAGLMTHLRVRRRFTGITNGLDTEAFDPSRDRSLAAPYSRQDLAGRRACKRSLQHDLGLVPDATAPVIGVVSRICEQKGHDLLADAVDAVVAMGAQIAVLGVGDAAMTAALRQGERRWPGRVAVRIGFDAYLANRIYAGSDMFLMPSRFEPCGLGQLIAMRYGSVPVVRRTGGLADTVRDADSHPRSGNGFVFDEASATGIVHGVSRAIRAYGDPAKWTGLVDRGMAEDHGWRNVVPSYERLYQRALRRAPHDRPHSHPA